MLKKSLVSIILIISGIFILLIPDIVSGGMINTSFEGTFYDVFFVVKCIFVLMSTLLISYSLISFINKV